MKTRLAVVLASVGGVALLLGFLPYLYVRTKRNKRMRDFEQQLPEALDIVVWPVLSL